MNEEGRDRDFDGGIEGNRPEARREVEGAGLPEGGSPARDAPSPGRAFIQGFLVRGLYGLLGLAVVAVIRPDIYVDHREIVWFAVGLYVVVCTVGGVYDAATRQRRTVKVFQKPRAVDIALLVIIIAVLLMNR
jgi:hypothetical protein